MAKAAYFDMFSGASGDMILGALVDAGLPLEDLATGLSGLKLGGYSLKAGKVRRGVISATQVKVIVGSKAKQPHRSYKDIVSLISTGNLKPQVKKQAEAVFKALGQAEAKVHGVKLDDVHFHEVGAVDSIVDIVGAAIGFDLLGITGFYASPFPIGTGMVNCRHGGLPVPAPAALELIRRAEAPVIEPPHAAMTGKELVTPTGAAIVTTLAEFHRPEMRLSGSGYGAGSQDFESCPNVMRLWIGEVLAGSKESGMVLLETNIDDMNPQIYDYVMDKLFKAGALDVWLTPIQMKKNRPAVLLSALAPGSLEHAVSEIILRETTTLGVRVRPVARHVAERETRQVETSLGKVTVKVRRVGGKVVGVTPEYEECRQIAAKQNLELRNVCELVEEAARKKFRIG
jgi:uncharacterized protein (TIGR00299 family) protein